MPKKRVYVGSSPEGKRYYEEIEVPASNPEEPPENFPPGGDGTLSKSELMEKKFKDAGCPTKGAQPSSDFQPD